MNAEASQDGSQRGQLLFRRTSAACNMLSDKLSHVRLHSEGSSTQLAPPVAPAAAAAAAAAATVAATAAAAVATEAATTGPAAASTSAGAAAAAAPNAAAPMSQDGPPTQLTQTGIARQPSQQLLLARGLTIDTTRYPSQSDMAW
jgi:hypothetical protein